MKSFFKTWKKKELKTSPKNDVPPPSTGSTPGRVPESQQWPSASPTSSSSSNISEPSTFQLPALRLEASASSSNDTFSSSVSVEHSSAYAKPARQSPDHRLYPSHHSPSPHTPQATLGTPVTSRHGAPLNFGHGPPKNIKHGPPNVLQAQLSSIKSGKVEPTRLPYQSYNVLPSSTPHRQDVEPIPNHKTRTPPRVKFDSSVDLSIPSRASRVSLAEARRPPDFRPTERKVSWGDNPIHPDPESLLADDKESQTPHTRQPQSPSNGNNLASPTDRTGSPSTKGLKLYHSSQSSPHLPARTAPDDREDISSLFPSPPPLIIRKKVPQPLVLQPRKLSGSTVVFPPSPNPSSTDSTPVSTPTSSRQLITPTQSPILKAPLVRHGNTIPPPLYNAPTSPLPSPPVNSHSKTFAPRQPTYSLHARAQLRGALSTTNLRHGSLSNSNLPTHRMTSSDPMASSALQRLTKGKAVPRPNQDPPRGYEEGSLDSSQDPPVQWGYAL